MKTILVVDDEYAILDALRAILEDEGYAVLTAADGKEALELLDKGPVPDALLIDVMMPIMDGREVVEVVRKRPATSTVPVILMSAAPRALARGADLGVAANLQKPFAVDTLLDTL